MKINGIKALDYQCQGENLTLVLSETTFDAVSNLNTALVEVRTDDGDLVEAHGGYALRAITYDKDKQTYTVACTTAADDLAAGGKGGRVDDQQHRTGCTGGLHQHDDRYRYGGRVI